MYWSPTLSAFTVSLSHLSCSIIRRCDFVQHSKPANCSEASHHCFYKLVQAQQQGEMNLNFGLPAWEERQYLTLCRTVRAGEELCLQACDAHSSYICNLLIAKPFTRKEIWLLVWNLLSKHLFQIFPENHQPGGCLYLVAGLQPSSHLIGVTEKCQPLWCSAK